MSLLDHFDKAGGYLEIETGNPELLHVAAGETDCAEAVWVHSYIGPFREDGGRRQRVTIVDTGDDAHVPGYAHIDLSLAAAEAVYRWMHAHYHQITEEAP